MPRRSVKSYKKKRKSGRWKSKKRYSRKTSGKRNYLKLNTGLLPQGKLVNMNYHRTLTLQSNTGIQMMNTFRMNSIYDPDQTSTVTGWGQPLGHDQYALYFQTYQVIGAKVTVKFRWDNLATSTTANRRPVLCIAHPDDDTAETDYAVNHKRERYPGLFKVLNPDETATVTIVNHFSAKKFFSLKSPTADSNLLAGFSANPLKQAYCNLGVQTLDGVSTSPTVLIDVRIQYIVRLTQPHELASS